MRPLEVTLEGFKSYREPATFNFESRGLFAIVGPTGAGKSSILEALIFGFYGKTPRLERDTKKLIHSGRDEAKVHLAFEAGGRAWAVTRVIRRKGSSQVVLKSLDATAAIAGDSVTGERAVNDRITEILGLDFAAFCASVSLPQGEFDRFLKATPGERVRILKGVFGLDKVGRLKDAAKAASNLISGQLAALNASLGTLPPDPEQLLEDLKAALAEAAKRLADINGELENVRAAEHRLAASTGEIDRLEQLKVKALRTLESMPPEQVLLEVETAREQAEHRHRSADAALKQAADRLREAAEAVESIEAEGRGQSWCTKVEAEINALESLDNALVRTGQEVDRLGKHAAEAQATLVSAEQLHRQREKEEGTARSFLSGLQQDHAAHFLRLHLVAGEPCPVCEHKVASVPAALQLPAVERGEQQLTQAEKALADSRRALEAARQDVALTADRLGRAQKTFASGAQERDLCVRRLSELVPPGGDPVKQLESACRRIEHSRQQLKAAMAAHQSAAANERQLRDSHQALSAQQQTLAMKVSQACGQLGLEGDLVEVEGINSAAKKARESGMLQLASWDKQIQEQRTAALSAGRKLQEFRRRFGGRDGQSSSDILATAASEASALERDVQQAKITIKRKNAVQIEIESLSKRRGLYERLSADLTDHKFTAYLLEGQSKLLAALASEKLKELTGHYVFDEEGDFEVLDLRTGAVRTPDTLSGGESFLASLSLALALAEAVGREGGRLGCFFLDEGFGSLDQESLDLALDGIEALALPGRLIGLISHVGGIQTRLDDLIILERNDDGSTTVAQDGGPIAYLPSLI